MPPVSKRDLNRASDVTCPSLVTLKPASTERSSASAPATAAARRRAGRGSHGASARDLRAGDSDMVSDSSVKVNTPSQYTVTRLGSPSLPACPLGHLVVTVTVPQS